MEYQFEDWFVAKVNGKPVFRVVTTFFTSAEFALDELTGSYQPDLGRLEVANADRGQQYDTQCQYWDESLGKIVYNTFEPLEKISEIRPFKELWTATTLEICDDETERQIPALSLHRKKEILTKLQELEIDVDKPASRSSKRKPR